MRNTLCEFLIVIAAVAKVSCKHGLWLVARVNHKIISAVRTCIFIGWLISYTKPKDKEGIIQTWN